MRHGAYHYISKDFDPEGVRTLRRATPANGRISAATSCGSSAEVAEQNEREFVVGPSRATRDIVELVQKIAKLSATVLILGESGTGKELLARLIHRESATGRSAVRRREPRRDPEGAGREHALRPREGRRSPAPSGSSSASSSSRPAARCSSTRSAICGYELQAKLLRAIQEGEIERVGGTHPIKTDFRLIAATNVDLDKAVKEGRFREDLYYRLNVIPIRMPALRDRIEDLPELARFFLRRYNLKFRKNIQGIADSTLQILQLVLVAGQHPRAREPDRAPRRGLRQGLDHRRRPAATSSTSRSWTREGPTDREPARARGHDLRAQLHHPRAREIGWNVTATARCLGIPLSTLKFKMDGSRSASWRARSAAS